MDKAQVRAAVIATTEHIEDFIQFEKCHCLDTKKYLVQQFSLVGLFFPSPLLPGRSCHCPSVLISPCSPQHPGEGGVQGEGTAHICQARGSKVEYVQGCLSGFSLHCLPPLLNPPGALVHTLVIPSCLRIYSAVVLNTTILRET